MTEILPKFHKFRHAYTSIVWTCLATFLAVAILGYGAFAFLFSGQEWTPELQLSHPFADCFEPGEYFLRCAILCRSTVFQLLCIWASAYMAFEKPLLLILFGIRGLSAGIAACFWIFTTTSIVIPVFLAVYIVITGLFLRFSWQMHTDSGRMPYRESWTLCMIFGGIACLLLLLPSLLLC